MMKTFFAKLMAAGAPLVLALSLAAAPNAAHAQATPEPAPAVASITAPTADPSASSVAAPAPTAPAAMPAAATTKVDNPYGIGALWAQSDLVAKAVLAILAIMSMGSWYVIVTKLLEQMRMGRQAREVDNEFWNERTVQATVGSTAPFVGLFGTVWGIYNALVRIGASGQASIDKVAGPVGEALIMTAIGLAVAVPAVLGYNWLVRRNKVAMDTVRAFGSDLHTVLLATGGKGA
jgi:biopolymer transport protein ExbB